MAGGGGWWLQDLTGLSLEGLIPAHTVMVIKITATTTPGKPLPEEQLTHVLQACQAALTLEDFKRKVAHRSPPLFFSLLRPLLLFFHTRISMHSIPTT